MRYLLKLLLLPVLLLLSVNAYGATATVNKVWVEHGVKYNNRSAMKVNFSFTVKNGKGENMSWCLWILGPDGNWHTMNNAQKSSSGASYKTSSFTPPYDSTDYNNAWCYLYLDDLNLLPGKNTYKILVTVHDKNQQIVGRSSYVSFEGTGPQRSGNNAPSNQSYNKGTVNNNNSNVNNNSGVQTWREELGYGGFVIVKKFPNGYIMRTRYRICPSCNGTKICGSCHGTGMCSICHGQGGIISAGYGNYYPCYVCQTSGRCMLCKGNRVCSTCANQEYPGYAIGSISTIAPDGTTTHDTANYNDYDSSSRRNNSGGNSNTVKGCSQCGGTGVSKTPNSGGSLSSWVAYYNSSGTKCPYCGAYTSHYHDRCSNCNVPR